MAVTSVFQALSLLVVLFVSVVFAADDSGSLTMTVTDSMGTTVQAEGGTTEFMGTEYNPDKCELQFQSLECDDNCAELNGYELECVSKGVENGKDKKMCECKAEDATVCQNATSPDATSGTVPQFGECSEKHQCVDSYGYIATPMEEGPICAERLHCVRDTSKAPMEPTFICHTCMSCIAQNYEADKTLAGGKHFKCSTICPQEIVDSVAERDAAGVGIADSYSLTASSAGSDESDNSTASNSLIESNSNTSNAGSSAASAVAHASVAAIIAVALMVAMN